MKPLSSITKLSCGVAVFALSSLLWVSKSHPATLARFCEYYASVAIYQQTYNTNNRCGYSGARWHGNTAIHQSWCMLNGRRQARREKRARDRQIEECVARQRTHQQGWFYQPRFEGTMADWCRSWAQECGQPGADAFCARNGYAFARRFRKQDNIGILEPTIVVRSGRVCRGDRCDGFEFIVCENPR